MNRPPLRRVLTGLGLAVAVPLAGWLAVLSRTEWIPAGHVGIIYDASSGLRPEVYDPRALYIGLRQQLYVYPTRLQAAIYSQDQDAGENRAADGILVTTNDNANTTFDITVVYRVRRENVPKIFNAFGPRPIEDLQRTVIRRTVKEAANEVSTQYDLFALMGPKREEAAQRLTRLLQERLGDKGFEVEAAMLGASYPSNEIQSKITSRVNSYVELEISRLKREIAEIDRQIAVVSGTANQQAAALAATQTKDRSLELLRLEATQAAVEKWDGHLSPISPKNGQTLFLPSDLLKGVGGQ